jgi:hypothetical protein
MKLATALLTLMACAALLIGGCSSSSGPDESDGYLNPTSPENVQVNLERAYSEMNVEEYLACLSSDFKFYFTEVDQWAYPELPPWWYKSDEEQVHADMFLGQQPNPELAVESIELTLATAHAETIPGPDPRSVTDDVIVHVVDFSLYVNLMSGLTFYAVGSQEFRFRAETDAHADGTTWEIFEWYDMEDYEESPGSREDAGWGGIKFVFLDHLTQPSRRTSPEDVIHQLKESYVAMDLEDYLDCLSADFVFYPSEEDVGQGIPEFWEFATEQTIHTNMFSADPPNPEYEVESIQLQLANVSVEEIPGPDTQDPYDDIEVHTESVVLYVYLQGGWAYYADGPSEFWLRADPDEVGPYGELMWEIFEWHELLEVTPVPSDGRVESSSWGAIKALFR